MIENEVKNKNKHALIVEGGAMRGIFAAGVLDAFLDFNFNPFDFCIGVSAGSTNIAAWLAGQRDRNYKVITDYSCRPQFIVPLKFLFGGHLLDLDWLWEITIREIGIDVEAMEKSGIPLYIVTTRVDTGKAEYYTATADNLETLMKSSCAIPVFYRGFPPFNEISMTDGGVADSIPVKKAYEMGAREITVILSQPDGYRKKEKKIPWFIRKDIFSYPELINAMDNRGKNYNESLDFINNPPSDCIINTIIPDDTFKVGRTTKNKKLLDEGYAMGLQAGELFVKNKLNSK